MEYRENENQFSLFLEELQNEIQKPSEIVRSAFECAVKCMENEPANEKKRVVYDDIQRIRDVISSKAPYDYAVINKEITAKYDSIPPVNGSTFSHVSLEELRTKSTEENIRVLSLIARSLAIMITNIDIGLFFRYGLEGIGTHSLKAGVRAVNATWFNS